MTAERLEELAYLIDRTKRSKHPHAPLWVLIVEMARNMELAGVVVGVDDDATAEKKLRAWVGAGRPGLIPAPDRP